MAAHRAGLLGHSLATATSQSVTSCRRDSESRIAAIRAAHRSP